MKVVNTPTLLELMADARRRNYNRQVELPKEVVLDLDGRHLVMPVLFHNDSEFRCELMIKVRGTMEPLTAYLDIAPEVYNALPDSGIEEGYREHPEEHIKLELT